MNAAGCKNGINEKVSVLTDSCYSTHISALVTAKSQCNFATYTFLEHFYFGTARSGGWMNGRIRWWHQFLFQYIPCRETWLDLDPNSRSLEPTAAYEYSCSRVRPRFCGISLSFALSIWVLFVFANKCSLSSVFAVTSTNITSFLGSFCYLLELFEVPTYLAPAVSRMQIGFHVRSCVIYGHFPHRFSQHERHHHVNPSDACAGRITLLSPSNAITLV